MTCTVLIVAGLPGSGKTTVSSFFKRTQRIPVVRMGVFTEKILQGKGLPVNEKGERQVRQEVRQAYGNDIYAKTALPVVQRECRENAVVILEGVKSEEEREYIEKYIPSVKLLSIDTPKAIRYGRLLKRKVRPLTQEEAQKRDTYELESLKFENLKKQADFLVKNEGTKKELYGALRGIFQKLTYGKN